MAGTWRGAMDALHDHPLLPVGGGRGKQGVAGLGCSVAPLGQVHNAAWPFLWPAGRWSVRCRARRRLGRDRQYVATCWSEVTFIDTRPSSVSR